MRLNNVIHLKGTAWILALLSLSTAFVHAQNTFVGTAEYRLVYLGEFADNYGFLLPRHLKIAIRSGAVCSRLDSAGGFPALDMIFLADRDTAYLIDTAARVVGCQALLPANWQVEDPRPFLPGKRPQSVNGIPCEHFQATTYSYSGRIDYQFWTAPSLPIDTLAWKAWYWMGAPSPATLPGLPLKVLSYIKDIDLFTTYELVRLDRSPPPASWFALPPHFERRRHDAAAPSFHTRMR